MQIDEQIKKDIQVHDHKELEERNSNDELQEDQSITNITTENSGQPYTSCMQIGDTE